MAICGYCNGTAKCDGCAGRGVQFDGRVCALCGGSGICQRCTNGQRFMGLPEARRWPWLDTLRPVLPRLFQRSRFVGAYLAGTALALALPFGGAAQAQTTGASVVFLPPGPGAGGPNTRAIVISGDSTVVIGDDFEGEVLWRNGVPERIGGIIGGPFINDVSGDGSVFVGGGDDTVEEERRGFFWTRATGVQFLPDVGARQPVTSADGISSDGRFIAVTALTIPPELNPSFNDCRFKRVRCISSVYRWSQAGGYESIGQIGTLPLGNGNLGMRAVDISNDGNAITGDIFAEQVGSEFNGVFLWRSGTGLTELPYLSNTPVGLNSQRAAYASGISGDSGTVIGRSVDANGFNQAVYWRNGAITGLGFMPGTNTAIDFTDNFHGSAATAVSADGAIIVGSQSGRLVDGVWRWTASTGMQDLNQIVRDAGLSLDGFVLGSANGISDSGAVIAGTAGRDVGTSFQQLGYVLQIAQITRSQLIVQVRLPGTTLTSTVNQTFNTEVLGTLNGATVFTRSFADRIDTAAGTAAFNDARAALGVSALRRVTIGAPTLISNVTTVTGSTNNTVDVLSGTQITTATVNASGPTTVITGDRGICATAAANNTNPTGCSLAGTPVAVPSGILNSNIFTNTAQSITPTTTQTVSQLISAKWQVAAIGGNQFGTVHALAGVAAFDRGDRLVWQLLGMGGSVAPSGANGVARRAIPTRSESALGGEGSGLTMFGGYFGNWSRIDADARVPVADVKGNSNGFVLGLEKSLGDSARIGIAFDHGASDFTVRDATFPETLSLKHTHMALFAGWNSGGFSLDGAAAYGFGSAKTSLTTPTTPATGSRKVRSWSLGAQAGYTVPLGKSASLTPHIGIRHVSAKLDRFTETGGPTPLIGLDQTVTRTRIYAGLEAKAGIDAGSIKITPRLYGRIARDSGDARGTADLVFASAPNGPTLTAYGPGVGRSVAEVGGSLEAAVSGAVHIWAGYDGTFRDGGKSHAAKVGIRVAM